MSFFSLLHPVFESKRYPHARTYRATFGQKMYDTYSFWGGTLLDGVFDSSRENNMHFGFFDYCTLGIPYVLSCLSLMAFHASFKSKSLLVNIFLMPFFAITSVVLLAPRYIFAGIMTLICMPFVGIAQLAASFEGDRLKGQILVADAHIVTEDEKQKPPTTTWGKLLQEKGMTLENITGCKLEPDPSSKSIVRMTFTEGSKVVGPVKLMLGAKKDKELLETFRQLNLGGFAAAEEPAPRR